MGRQKVYIGESGIEITPYFHECRRASHIFPGKTMNMREKEFLCGRADQAPFQGHHVALSYNRYPDCTGAVTAVIGGFKIDGREAVFT